MGNCKPRIISVQELIETGDKEKEDILKLLDDFVRLVEAAQENSEDWMEFLKELTGILKWHKQDVLDGKKGKLLYTQVVTLMIAHNSDDPEYIAGKLKADKNIVCWLIMEATKSGDLLGRKKIIKEGHQVYGINWPTDLVKNGPMDYEKYIG